MRHRLCTCALALLVMLCAAPARAQFNVPRPPAVGEDYRVEVGAMLWKPSPEAVISNDAFDPIGREVDFVQEFGIESKRFTEYRITLKPAAKHKLRFQYLPITYEASALVQRDIVFGGRTFTVGATASTRLEWKQWRFGYEWDFVSNSYGFVGLVAELKHNTVSAEIDAGPFGSAAADPIAPVPGLGIIGRGYLSKNASVTAEFTGFKVPDSITEEFDGELWDFDIYGTVNFSRNAGVQAGYRSLDVEYLADEDFGRLTMRGLYFGGVVRF